MTELLGACGSTVTFTGIKIHDLAELAVQGFRSAAENINIRNGRDCG